ncbi:glutathione S-transferase [Variovorax sp. LT1R16]|uniref:glutathione S-transferase n=1 Tax=Variovorax sp. LT1R16 TaxID=3443728 RepID=UPI003F44AC80
MQSTALPVLYSFRRCPYAMRARFALLASGTRCELREVVLRDKPAALLGASPKATVPVLVLPDGQVIDQSLDIMRWALARRDPQAWLQPPNETLEAMLVLIAHCDGAFKQQLDRYKYPDRFEGVDALQQRAEGALFLQTLNARLAATSHLFGDRPTLADMAIAPFVRQFAQVDAAWFAAQPWPALAQWLADLTASETWREATQKYPPWVPGAAVQVFP